MAVLGINHFILASLSFLRYNATAVPGVAQLVARVLWEHEAASSSLATRTIDIGL